MNALIEVNGVYKNFDRKGHQNTNVLEDINLKIKEGELLAILGPSGSGKSTLLRIIAGLVPASQGTVTYLGQPIQGVNHGVAVVFQSFALFPWLTVLGNVLLGLEASKLSAAQKRDKALQVIDLIGLDGFESAYPKELSGGMRQRVGIGRALVNEPDVLLMDEPFSSLDVLTAENLRRDLLELWLDKRIPTKSIILVTHSIEEAVYMADRALVLSARPAKVVEDIRINIPRWRDKKAADFIALVDRIYSLMTRKEIQSCEPTIHYPQTIVAFPCVSDGALTGFLELLEDMNEKTDLYKLADRFVMDIGDFLPIVELASLLGFAKVTEGDIELTPGGIQFARATVLERKEIFKDHLLQNVPFMTQMINILQSKSNKHMSIEFFEDLIAHTLGDDTARTQINLIISWGRYAELIGYKEEGRQVYLEGSV